MTIEQDFLPYAVGSNANVLTQSQYSALTTLLQSGMSSGIVPSNQLNKILRQPSIIASVIAQLIVANAGQPAIDDGTTATLLANLQTAITVIARQNPVLADTGTANTYAAANAAAFTAYPSVSGLVIDVAIANANTGASTLAIDGLAAKPIYGLALLPLQGGELPKGIASFIYIVASTVNSGNGGWVLMEAPGGAQQVGVATASQHAATLGQVQSGLSSYAIDAGTANTYVVALSPAITAYTDGVKIRFRALTTNTGASTVNVNGLGAVALVGGAHTALAGGEIVPGGYCEAEYNGALSKFVLLECTGAALQVSPGTQSSHAAQIAQLAQIQNFNATVAGNALTGTYTPTGPISFRNATVGGAPVTLVPTSAFSLVVPFGATLGTVAATQARLLWLLLYNAGSPVVGVVNLASGINFDETGLISSVAISSGATASNVVYTVTAVTNSPYRVIGFCDLTEATAGTWSTAPTVAQGAGGQAIAAMGGLGYGQTMQNVAASRAAGTTYYNATGRPIQVNVSFIGSTASATIYCSVNGIYFYGSACGQVGNASGITFVVPPGGSYSATMNNGTSSIGLWAELR